MKKLLIATFALFFAATPAFAQPLPVVATFSILGDMVKTIGGDDVSVTTLVGPDTDTHTYEPLPANARAVAAAKVVFVNGLGFEGWMNRLAQSSGTKVTIVTATTGVQAHKMDEDGKTVTDPHAWQSLANGHIYVRNITDALVTAIPDKADAIRARAKTYDAQITATDTWVQDQLKGIPEDRRLIITSHDAFGYFAAAYGIRIAAPEGVSTESEPSAKQVARLIDQIKTHHVRSVFFETMASPRLIQQIAAQTGADASQSLYSDALSKADGPAPTYLSMFRHNVPLMAASMKR